MIGPRGVAKELSRLFARWRSNNQRFSILVAAPAGLLSGWRRLAKRRVLTWQSGLFQRPKLAGRTSGLLRGICFRHRCRALTTISLSRKKSLLTFPIKRLI